MAACSDPQTAICICICLSRKSVDFIFALTHSEDRFLHQFVHLPAESLAALGKKLANDGVCIKTGKRFMSSQTARIAKTLMLTCGMYDGSGTFAIRVGIPTKSGVGGGLLSVSDKRAGIGVFGPALDAQGNSIAGCKLLREISNELRLNLFYDPEWDKEEAEETVLKDMQARSVM